MLNLWLSLLLLGISYFQYIECACQKTQPVQLIDKLSMPETLIRTWMSSDGRYAAATNTAGQLSIKSLLRNEMTTYCDLNIRHKNPRETCVDPSFKWCAYASHAGLHLYDLQKRTQARFWSGDLHYPKFSMTGSLLAYFDTQRKTYFVRDIPSEKILINSHDAQPNNPHIYFNTENTHCALRKGSGIEFYDTRTGGWRKHLWDQTIIRPLTGLTSICTIARPYFLLNQCVGAVQEDGTIEVFDINLWSMRRFNTIQCHHLSKVRYWRSKNLWVVASIGTDKKTHKIQYTNNEFQPPMQEFPPDQHELSLVKVDPTGRFFIVSMIGPDGKPSMVIHDGQTMVASKLACGARRMSFASDGTRAITNNGDIIQLYENQ